MNAEQLAYTLGGSEYPVRISKSVLADAKESGLLIIYGESDDLMELDGAFTDEIGAYGGFTALVGPDGVYGDRDDEDSDSDMLEFLLKKKEAKKVRAIWGEYEGWSYETEIHHVKFGIFEDGKIYSKGIVIDIKDLK